jgi:AraC family transcriptional regulator of adaptative response/methylated-DNA-[protein]-cysteine methyltransferase
MIAVADEDALHLIEFADRPSLPAALNRLQQATRSGVTVGRVPPIDQVEVELADYFDGRSSGFETPLAFRGSAFARDVWQRLREIPLGELRSYSELAAAVGRPAAVRAAARANGANPFAIVVPCHRVIGADGSLTGYGGGLWRKRWLIEHESRLTAKARRTEATPSSTRTRAALPRLSSLSSRS